MYYLLADNEDQVSNIFLFYFGFIFFPEKWWAYRHNMITPKLQLNIMIYYIYYFAYNLIQDIRLWYNS
jgi:hypothetical protein